MTDGEGFVERFLREQGPPQATVAQEGRWSYQLFVNHGSIPVYERRYLGTRRGAERNAARKLARYARRLALKEQWWRERTVIKEPQ